MKKSILIVILLTVGITQAQRKWTLKECVEYALENNIDIKQSELDLQAVDAEKLESIGNWLPSLNASTNVVESSGLNFNPTTNRAETTTFLSSTPGINAGYTLFDGLRNIRASQRAEISELAAQYRLAKMKDDISLLVANSYLRAILDKENLKSLMRQNEVTKEQIERTQELVNAGVLPEGDLLEIKATDANEQQTIVTAENSIRISLISLAQLLLIKDYENFDIQEEGYNLVNEDIAGKSVDEIIDAAKEVRSEVKIAQQNVELAMKDLQIARSSYYPRLTAFFGYNTRFTSTTSFDLRVDPDNPIVTEQIGRVESTGEAVVADVPNTFFVEEPALPYFEQLWRNDGISYGLSLSIPILNGLSSRSNVIRNKINLERTQNQLDQTELDLESTVYQAFVDAEGALKSYDAALSALESQQLAFNYAEERYNVGIINSFEYSQSKFNLDAAIITANRAKYDYIFKLKVLELYFGIPAVELKF
ncbi:TolC family protein [Winogradskyella aurantiaca]|uniref:TolC family protein n=1 Tax=Winogradskyella aurantiaca TaxID=2219558 RepID=UPI000E1C7171|nr:TolC family protein [Winogradskyella aurantiaca]